jgi:hypothetical protein
VSVCVCAYVCVSKLVCLCLFECVSMCLCAWNPYSEGRLGIVRLLTKVACFVNKVSSIINK